jgi:heptosyltransferase-1
LGDVIHNLPVVSDLKSQVPDSEVHWVVEDSFASVPRMHPGVDRVIAVAMRRWRKRLLSPATWKEIVTFNRELKSSSYDYIIDTQGLMKSALIARRAKGPVYGQDRASAREPMASRIYDYTFNIDRCQHAVQRNRQLAASVFGYDLDSIPLNYGIEGTIQSAKQDWVPQSDYLVFLHGTSRQSKLWPEANWVELGRQLSNTGLKILLPWGNASEHDRAQRLASAIDTALVTPPTNLDTLAGVLAGAQAVIGVDTGPVHLAVAINRPTIAVYTDTDPVLTGVLPMEPERAINVGNKDQIPTADLVYQALQQVLVHA